MLIQPRVIFKPFEYPEAHEFWLAQQSAHWLHTEIAMGEDIHDWETRLTEAEKNVVGTTLKGFVQAEVVIGDYWTSKVAQWFPKPEVALMASAFGAMEGIHQMGYAYLQDSLGLDDYLEFLHEPSAKAKIDRLMETGEGLIETPDLDDIARSLAIFSGFAEGVSLYSSFAILLYFSKRNLLKGLGQIIAFSIRDESTHSQGGVWLFNTLCKETPGLRTAKLEEDINEAARLTIVLEDDFIDKAFEMGEIEDFSSDDLKAFIRFRCNNKLVDLGYKPLWDVEEAAIQRMAWFDALSAGTEHQDFFAGRVTEYAKGGVDWDSMWDGISDTIA